TTAESVARPGGTRTPRSPSPRVTSRVMHATRLLAGILTVLALAAGCGRDVQTVRLVTTTSVRDSGLMDALLPEYEKETGVHVDLVAVGTGAAFQVARDGNADLLLVHDRKG